MSLLAIAFGLTASANLGVDAIANIAAALGIV